MNSKKTYIEKAKELTESKYIQESGIWDFGDINDKANIVVYGAGLFGNKLVEYLNETGIFNIVAWVDKDYKNKAAKVESPIVISERQFDYLFIAIKDEQIQEEVKKNLRKKYGLEIEKIISPFWNNKKLNDLYENEYRNSQTITWEDKHTPIVIDEPYSITSMICNQGFLDMPFAIYWAKLISGGTPYYHRKLWELVYISQGLYERNLLRSGKRGISFGTGEECLPDLFASMGCEITATDLDPTEEMAKGWIDTNQNAAGDKEKLRKRHFCNDKDFDERVKVEYVNMNAIPDKYNGKYDFCWSACALEHIGSIKKGCEFIKNSLNVLKPGGYAIHTTEYNLFSNDATIDENGLCLFRKKDIEKLINELMKDGYEVSPMDWFIGDNIVDSFIDIPPSNRKKMHLRLLIDKYPCTSIGIVIKKPESKNK